MAKSKYEYVKSFEVRDKIMLPTIIVVVIDGRNFRRFAEVHEFAKPLDGKALDLMKSCATAVMEKFGDISFSYGFSDEFSFVLKKDIEIYNRRESKLLSVLVSFFTSVFVKKWKDFFPQKLRFAPSFRARVVQCPTLEVLQTYLDWRQRECHLNYLYDTCLWNLIRMEGRDPVNETDETDAETKARKILEGTQKKFKHDLLFKQFKINYNNLPPMFRRGTFLIRTKWVVEHLANGVAVNRSTKKIVEVHSVINKCFWNQHPSLIAEFGGLENDINFHNTGYIESFQVQDKLMLSTWIVVRIDGCKFHGFSASHDFTKPNDISALNLMNSCGAAVLDEFKDIIFAYGASDEFSFVLRKDSKLYDRHRSGVVSAIVSFFTSMYIMKWKEFFQQKELQYQPSFDGRAVCYPSLGILRDYLSWRQVDCYINYQYNTCFQLLVDSRLKGCHAHNILEHMPSQKKNDMLKNIDSDKSLEIFRRGSCIFWDKACVDSNILFKIYHLCKFWNKVKTLSCGDDSPWKIVIEHCDIIDEAFWKAHPWILCEERSGPSA